MTDRPAHTEDEIEVTPEMIEAGIDEMWGYDLDTFKRDEWRQAIKYAFIRMKRLERLNI